MCVVGTLLLISNITYQNFYCFNFCSALPPHMHTHISSLATLKPSTMSLSSISNRLSLQHVGHLCALISPNHFLPLRGERIHYSQFHPVWSLSSSVCLQPWISLSNITPPHGRTFHCLQDIRLCSSHTEHKEQDGRGRDDNQRKKGGGQVTWTESDIRKFRCLITLIFLLSLSQGSIASLKAHLYCSHNSHPLNWLAISWTLW